jgi:hypothetical protein
MVTKDTLNVEVRVIKLGESKYGMVYSILEEFEEYEELKKIEV